MKEDFSDFGHSSPFQFGFSKDSKDSPSKGSFVSEESGNTRTIDVVPKAIAKQLEQLGQKPNKEVDGETINNMRRSIRKNFGGDIANHAFREIDYRSLAVKRGLSTKSKPITAQHLISATSRALELAAPRISAKIRIDVATQIHNYLSSSLEYAQKQLKKSKLEQSSLSEKRQNTFTQSVYEQQRTKELQTEIPNLEKIVTSLKRDLLNTELHLSEAKVQYNKLQEDPLGESKFGRAQSSLDHVAEDKRFFELLNNHYAKGQAVDGSAGTGKRVFSKNTPLKVIKEVGGYVLPPIGIGLAFKKAISAEDRERRFKSASQNLPDNPLARALSTTLSVKAEQEKWKKGLSGTVGFAAMGLTLHLGPIAAPGISVMTSSMSKSITKGVSHHVSKVVLAKTASYGVNRTGTEIGKGGAKGMFLPKEKTSSLDPTMKFPLEGEFLPTILSLDPMIKSQLQGKSLPTIPVKMIGAERTKEFDLGDPKVAQALLHYLGPKIDQDAINKGSPEETCRKELRGLIGVENDNEDLVPGRSDNKERDKSIRVALDDPKKEGAEKLIQSVSPMRLLYIAQGW